MEKKNYLKIKISLFWLNVFYYFIFRLSSAKYNFIVKNPLIYLKNFSVFVVAFIIKF